jgi:hypothetical protein
MKRITKGSRMAGILTACLAIFLLAAPVPAADGLRIQPMKLDCGIVEEGVSAVMKATVENVSAKDVHILNVRTN